MVRVQALNRGSKAFRLATSRFQLLDSQNQVFIPDRTVTGTPEPGGASEVEPGGRQVMAWGFLVPAGTRVRVGTCESTAGSLIVEMVPWSGENTPTG